MLKHYSRLRELMAKYGLTQGDLSNVANLSEVSISKKFSTGQDFKITPAGKIITFFRERGEDITFEELFCPRVETKVTGYQNKTAQGNPQ